LEALAERVEAGTTGEGIATGGVLIPMHAALPDMPSVHLNSAAARQVRHGAAVRADDAQPDLKDGEFVRLRDEEGTLLAVGVYVAAGAVLQPRVMLAGDK
ncbi:MAG: tRNA pseudouridine(55) synthase TruB, partial [Pyrinomonadaceae bacterium]